jgi:hypothetical protein
MQAVLQRFEFGAKRSIVNHQDQKRINLKNKIFVYREKQTKFYSKNFTTFFFSELTKYRTSLKKVLKRSYTCVNTNNWTTLLRWSGCPMWMFQWRTKDVFCLGCLKPSKCVINYFQAWSTNRRNITKNV